MVGCPRAEGSSGPPTGSPGAADVGSRQRRGPGRIDRGLPGTPVGCTTILCPPSHRAARGRPRRDPLVPGGDWHDPHPRGVPDPRRALGDGRGGRLPPRHQARPGRPLLRLPRGDGAEGVAPGRHGRVPPGRGRVGSADRARLRRRELPDRRPDRRRRITNAAGGRAARRRPDRPDPGLDRRRRPRPGRRGPPAVSGGPLGVPGPGSAIGSNRRRPGPGREPDRRLPGRRARASRARPRGGGRPRDAPPPGRARPDRARPDARAIADVPDRRSTRRLRPSRRPPARLAGLRRALGAALDGRLAVQRLGRLWSGGPREPAPHLAMARLDRRVPQRRRRL